jgi:formylglycine-generating enzyme required for sulfatase activity/tRNA A-37 threonylcarbamoyl transferase component Bud32
MLEKDDVIGDYKLEKFLGRGQFGEVWLAEKQLQFSTRKVRHALKFLLNTGDEIDFKSAEAEIDTWIEASGHPNVMSVLDMLFYKGYIIIVSEFAEGGSLKSWLGKSGGKAPSVEKGLEMMVGILHGLEHLHSKNVVHRDLKPDNILLQGNFPRITDFGISRIVSSGSMSTKAMGSPAYMSPESFSGNKSPQNDIWSAGVISYEMLTGALPFASENIYGLVNAIQADEINPLPESIHPELRKLFKTALQKDRVRRFQTAHEMRLAVEKVLFLLKTEEIEVANISENLTLIDPPGNLTLTDPLSDFPQILSELQDTITQPTEIVVTQNNEELKPGAPNAGLVEKELFAVGDDEVQATDRGGKRYLLAAGAGGSFLILAVLGYLISPIFVFSPNGSITNSASISLTNVQSTPPALQSNSSANMAANSNPKKVPTAPTGMVYVPGGEFTMGRSDGKSEAEKPLHQVSVKPFLMDIYEVTNRQYAEFVKATGHQPPSHWKNGAFPAEQANFPVVNVNWEDAGEYAKWAKKRLPTEEEWEFAARGTGNFLYPWGNAWQAGQAQAETQSFSEVGKSKGASPFGIYDLVGNAWEWTSSDFKPYEGGKLPDAFVGKPNLKTIRGGSFEATKDFATTTYRIGWEATGAPNYNRTGFRCVKDLD